MLTLNDIIKHLEKKGYTANLVAQNDGLYSDQVRLDLSNSEIDETFRIESDSDPNQQSVIYAIRSRKPQVKGVLIDSFGPHADPDKQRLIAQMSC